jgi:outer membrane protein assembly factor BamB
MFENAGLGYAGPAIVDGKLYTLGSRDGKEQLIVLNILDGKELWHADLSDNYENNWGDGPRNTPTVDGGVVYAMSADGTLKAINISTKKELWSTKMTDLGGKVPQWGYTESVLVDGENVICTPGGKKGAMAALNKKTGKVVWQSKDMQKDAWYSSIVIAEMHGKRVYVNLCQGNLFGVDAKDGAVLWKTDWRGGVAVIPTPIVKGNSVYITSGYKAGCKRVTIGKDWSVETNYDYNGEAMINHHGGVIMVGDFLYGHSDARREGGWTCQNFESGEVAWRSDKLGKGAIGYADGHFYCLDESSGKVVLIEANQKDWVEKGSFQLDPQTKLRKKDGRIWVHPVILDGKLYLRDQDLIYCFDVKGK